MTTLSVVSELSQVRESSSSSRPPPLTHLLLRQLRTFAWSPHPNYPDLMAVGLTTGRTLLLRLDASASPSASHSLNPALSAISLNPRHARPCNAVAFCRDQPGLLAVGLEKARGESLLIFDIEQSARSLDSGKDATPISAQLQSHSFQRDHGVPRNHSPTASPSSAEPRPLLQFGSSEAVTSAAFLVAGASSSPLVSRTLSGRTPNDADDHCFFHSSQREWAPSGSESLIFAHHLSPSQPGRLAASSTSTRTLSTATNLPATGTTA